MVLLLNIPLFIISFLKNGKYFFINAIAGTVLLSLFIDIFDKFEPLTNDRFLACIYGGIIAGIGTAIILKANASTGGTDLLTQIIKAYKPNIQNVFHFFRNSSYSSFHFFRSCGNIKVI